MQTKYERNYVIPGLTGVPVICDVWTPYQLWTTKEETIRGGGCCRPGLIFLHGGGFVEGDKDQFFGAASWLSWMVDAVSVTVQYRVAGQAPCPASIVDCLSVCTWMRNNCEEFGIDPELIFLIGGSSGANIAAMSMMGNERLLQEAELDSRSVFQPCNGIFLNGIYNLVEFYKGNPSEQDRVCLYFNRSAYSHELWERYSPVFCEKSGLHIFMLHGSQDEIVLPRQCSQMKKRLDESGSYGVIQIFKGKEHAWFNKANEQYPVLTEIRKFIELRRKEVLRSGIKKTGRVIPACNQKSLRAGGI